MKFQKISISALLLAGVLTLAVPVFAQQEVDPDRFEPGAKPEQNQKSAASHHKSAHVQAKNAKPAHIAPKANSKSEPEQVSAVVKSDSGSVQTARR